MVRSPLESSEPLVKSIIIICVYYSYAIQLYSYRCLLMAPERRLKAIGFLEDNTISHAVNLRETTVL